MAVKKGSKFANGYASVLEDEGVNYREIADIMSDIGFSMNHSSARNYILRVMTKFAKAFDEKWDLELSEDKLNEIAASPRFQSAISDLLHNLEVARK